MTQVALNEYANPVTLNSSGNGTAQIGPLSAREIWNPQNVHVNVSTNTNEATCSIYVGDRVSNQTFRDATFSGSTGDSTDKVNADTVKCGQYIFAVWEGGDAGSIAYLMVTGAKTI